MHGSNNRLQFRRRWSAKSQVQMLSYFPCSGIDNVVCRSSNQLNRSKRNVTSFSKDASLMHYLWMTICANMTIFQRCQSDALHKRRVTSFKYDLCSVLSVTIIQKCISHTFCCYSEHSSTRGCTLPSSVCCFCLH